VCFTNGIVPNLWCRSIIHPILKSGKDYREPLSYRSISLMSTVAKMFSYILNKRIVRFLERNDILSEEQNGFRKLRSCIDYLYTICTILRNRKTMKLDTYVCFVDFSKAFDSVNHSFLWHKIMVAGISGNMLQTIKSMYSNLKSCIRLNGTLTNWFSTDLGVRQGYNLALRYLHCL